MWVTPFPSKEPIKGEKNCTEGTFSLEKLPTSSSINMFHSQHDKAHAVNSLTLCYNAIWISETNAVIHNEIFCNNYILGRRRLLENSHKNDISYMVSNIFKEKSEYNQRERFYWKDLWLTSEEWARGNDCH